MGLWWEALLGRLVRRLVGVLGWWLLGVMVVMVRLVGQTVGLVEGGSERSRLGLGLGVPRGGWESGLRRARRPARLLRWLGRLPRLVPVKALLSP